MSRRKSTRNRHAQIRLEHLRKAALRPLQVYHDFTTKFGIVKGQVCLPNKSKKDRPIGKNFGESVTRVYRHKLRTDSKARY